MDRDIEYGELLWLEGKPYVSCSRATKGNPISVRKASLMDLISSDKQRDARTLRLNRERQEREREAYR